MKSHEEHAPTRPARLLFVEQFYHPEGWGGAELPRDLTVHLAQSGFRVEVICGSDQYAPIEGEPAPDPRESGVRIRRVPLLLSGAIHSRKLLRQLWFYLCLLPLLSFRRPPDAYVAQTNPPLAIVFIAAAAWLWRRPLLIIAMDIYPEVIIAHGSLRERSLPARTLARVFRWAYRRARVVVSLGPVMTERLTAKGVDGRRVVEIPNWSTGAPGVVRGRANALVREWGLDAKFVLLYSGNLGIAHEFETLLDALAEAVGPVPSLRLVVVGKGRRLASVQAGIRQRRLEAAAQFHDPLPAERMPEGMGVADVALVTLQPGFEGLVVPSKLQGYMARGIPIVYVGPRSDISEFVARAGCGVSFANGEARLLAAEIRRLQGDPSRLADYARRARSYYDAAFDKAKGLKAYESTIRALLGGERRPMNGGIAVTGASGFIGGTLCPHLAGLGFDVRELDRRALESGALDAALSGMSTVIHLAARAHVLSETGSDPDALYRESNLTLTQRLGEAARRAGVRRFVFVSSAGVLGAVSPPQGFDDDSQPHPHDAYSRTKLDAERWLGAELGRHMDLAIVRPPLVYGPHAKGNLMRLMRIALRGWPLPIGDLRAPRSLVSVRNLADMLSAIVTARAVPDAPMLVADRESTSVVDLYRAVSGVAGHRPWLPRVPQPLIRVLLRLVGRDQDVARLTGAYLLRPSVARLQLGWIPTRPMAQELRWMVESELSAGGRR